jgi:hypothetical protein
MAAGPTTRVSDVIVPEIFTPYTQNLTSEKSRLIQSGLISMSDLLNEKLAGGGLTFHMPAFKDLDNDSERTSTDTSVPFADADASLPSGVARPPNPQKIGTLQEIAVRINRNQSWSTSDLAAALAGADPLNAIASRVAAYWVRRLQVAFLAAWKGVIADNTSNDSGDYTNDVSGASFVDGVTNFSAAAFLDTTLTMGDSMEDLRAVMMHSVVYNRAQKNNLIDFVSDSVNGNAVSIPTFLGREVIVDDGMPRTGNVYETWMFGAGATQMGMGMPKVPTEVERKAGGGNGGGQDVLYNRVEWSIHPTGHSFVGSSIPEGGPSNTGTANSDLDEAASWNRVYPERKQIKFARLVTREA